MAEQEFSDWAVADWAVSQLEKPHRRPFFMGVGFFHPHLPWYVPRKHWEQFPPDSITLPAVPENDLQDIPPYAQRLALKSQFPMPDKLTEHERIVRHGQWRNAVSCYLAAVSYTDTLIGRVTSALENSRHAQNTVLIVWSDGGFHLGEKQHWRKFSLWERGTRSPLLIHAPGITKTGSQCVRPVSLTDLYPTLLDLTGLPPPEHELDGHSLLPLLTSAAAEWPHIALTTHLPGNHAVRSERWRYIRYKDGSEELYDHQSDPMEWKNLAVDSAFISIKQQLAAHMPAKAGA
jgi:arylsulfatase A-like enzyme